MDGERPILDRIGAIASGICAVHCLISGVALGVLSVIGLGFFGSLAVDVAFIGVACSVGTLAVVQGYRKHRSILPVTIYFSGLALIIASHAFGGHGQTSGLAQAARVFGAVGGGVLLVTFHFVNSRLQLACACPTCSGNSAVPSQPKSVQNTSSA